VGRIESGQMPLDQMLAGYQRGAGPAGVLPHRLEAVQDQIKVLDEGSAATMDAGMSAAMTTAF
jgi:exodeoxyribonuclease VII small subunit